MVESREHLLCTAIGRTTFVMKFKCINQSLSTQLYTYNGTSTCTEWEKNGKCSFSLQLWHRKQQAPPFHAHGHALQALRSLKYLAVSSPYCRYLKKYGRPRMQRQSLKLYFLRLFLLHVSFYRLQLIFV